MINLYDFKRKSETFSDGVPSLSWTVYETRKLDFQPVRMDKVKLEIDVGGQKYVPQFQAWVSDETSATASDRITPNSGTTDYLILRVHEWEDHKEFDLALVDDD